MKKFLLLLLTFVGMVSVAKAADDIYLRNNLNATSENSWYTWDNDISDYKLTFVETNASNEDVYYIDIDASNIDFDINFRFHINSWGAQISPYNNGDYSINIGANDKTSETYGARYEQSEFQSSTHYFTIPHTTLKASHYKIWALRGNSQTTYQNETAKYMWIYFEIVSMPVTIGSTGKATFCCNRALNFTDTGISAYTITGSVKATGALTTSSALGAVPANTGLYLEGGADTYNVPVLESASSVGTNWLVGVTSETAVAQTEDDGALTNYILTVNTKNGNVDTPKFFKVNDGGNTVPAGKAYLQIPTEYAAREFFWFDGETTAVKAVKQEQKFDGKVFNLAGQRIANPTKGLYIVNGKKVIK